MECTTGKICYPSPQAAWQTAGRIQRRQISGKSSTAYKCPECDNWHTTSTPWRSKKERKQ